ncbi:hypothetical protein M514_03562 [Trichuris suis]|uniref:Uncharacterized protein n=1 Tax=Trichuris suis TaxID=68888 RepID=A0A085NPB6_9BILA|nr:hypothetical protein M513_03562 [Trichuris suis]KFD71312.1 hypothetical protein M514_03562 [Trichuris suis]
MADLIDAEEKRLNTPMLGLPFKIDRNDDAFGELSVFHIGSKRRSHAKPGQVFELTGLID